MPTTCYLRQTLKPGDSLPDDRTYTLPHNASPGSWARKRTVGYSSLDGYMVHTAKQLLYRASDAFNPAIGPRIFVIELRGSKDWNGHTSCTQFRVIRETRWCEYLGRLFAADCSERALPCYESLCPGDTRPRDAVMAARAFAEGSIDLGHLMMAKQATGDAYHEHDASCPNQAAFSAMNAAWLGACWFEWPRIVKRVALSARYAINNQARDKGEATDDDGKTRAWRDEHNWQAARLEKYLIGDLGRTVLGRRGCPSPQTTGPEDRSAHETGPEGA